MCVLAFTSPWLTFRKRPNWDYTENLGNPSGSWNVEESQFLSLDDGKEAGILATL